MTAPTVTVELPPESDSAAEALLDRVEDASCNGDPECEFCHGDGSVHVPEAGAYAACVCVWDVEAAYDLVGDDRYLRERAFWAELNAPVV